MRYLRTPRRPAAALAALAALAAVAVTITVTPAGGRRRPGIRCVTAAAAVFSRLLNDGSALQLTTRSFLGADHEIINGIGVAPGYYIPLTARDVATGHDPDVARALAVLSR